VRIRRASPAPQTTLTRRLRQRIKEIGLEGIDTASLWEIVDIDSASLQKIVAAIAAAQWTLGRERKMVRAESRSPAPMNDAQADLAQRVATERAMKLIVRTLKVSLSASSIAPKPDEAGLKAQGRPRAMSETQLVLARLMLAEGVTREIIAQALKVSRSTLLNYLRPYGTGPHLKMRRPRRARSFGRGS
jgi:DNA-binding CsgD family transcriptional regulator